MNISVDIVDKITHNDYPDYHPSWSPDGGKISFGSGPTDEATEIYEFSFSTRESIRLTSNNHFDSFSDYSPSGDRMVWINWLPSDTGEVYILNLETRAEKRLTNTPVFEGWCSWDATGSEVYFSFQNMETRRCDIARIDVNTLESETVFSSMKHDARPQISNDGTRLVFNREEEEDISIVIMRLDD
jgi:TolB protein